VKDSSNVTDRRGGALFLVFLGVLGFSGTFPATRAGVPYLGAMTMSLGRAVIAATLAAMVLAFHRAPWPARRQLPGLALVGIGSVLGFPLLTALALKRVPVSHASVVVGVLPIVTAIVSVVRTGERPSRTFWAASVVGSAGVIAFTVGETGAWPSPADTWLLLGTLLSAVGYAEGARLAREMPAWRVISWALVLSAAPAAIGVGIVGIPPLAHVPFSAWLGLAYVSVVSMFVAFFAWYAGLARAGIARGSQVQLVMPFLSLTWAALLLGDTPPPRVWLALTTVVASIAVATQARMRTAKTPANAVGAEASPT
jgi:drug/metabolite transporter (DMT)-like permease